jgi:serine/threonine protein kinase
MTTRAEMEAIRGVGETGEAVTTQSGLIRADPLLRALINGKYRVLDVVASGGMGRVYRAEQTPLGRLVAIKVLLSDVAPGDHTHLRSEDDVAARFFREASVLAKVQHPNVVTVYDYGRIDDPPGNRERFFMAMEFLDGETLEERLDRSGPLSVAESIHVLRQMALGLRAAHARGIVHRDLKPSNLMIVKVGDGEEITKLVDFGVTKVLGESHDQDLTGRGIVVGSPPFMAPEQLVGGRVDGRTDIYSLGLIAHTMLAGSSPFAGRSAAKTMWAHLNEPIPALAGSRGDVPAWLDEVIQRCSAKKPEARFQTVDLLLDALGARLASSHLEPPRSLRRRGPYRLGRLAGAIPWPSAPPSADAGTESIMPVSDEIEHTPRKPSRATAAAVVTALAMVGLAAGIGVRSSSRPEASLSGVVAAARAAPAYRLSVVSTPPDAQVYEGGRLVGRTPLVTMIPAGAGVTHVELRRAGYGPYDYDVEASHDTEIVAVLTPEQAPATKAPPSSAPPPTRRWSPPPRLPPRAAPAPHDPFDKI